MIYGVIILAAILAQPAFSVNLKARFRTGCGFVNAVVEDCGYMTVSAAYGAIAILVAGMAFFFIRAAILTFPRVGCNRSKLPITPVVRPGVRPAANAFAGVGAVSVILPVAESVRHECKSGRGRANLALKGMPGRIKIYIVVHMVRFCFRRAAALALANAIVTCTVIRISRPIAPIVALRRIAWVIFMSYPSQSHSTNFAVNISFKISIFGTGCRHCIHYYFFSYMRLHIG